MTMQELSRYYRLRQKLDRNQELFAAMSRSCGLGAQVITDTPHAPGVPDPVPALAAELEELREQIAALESACAEERRKLERYLNTIPDVRTRIIFRLHFLRGMTWTAVARAMGGTIPPMACT